VACVGSGSIDFTRACSGFKSIAAGILDFAYELKEECAISVLGEYIWEKQVIPPAEQWAAGVTHLKSLGDYAAKLGFKLRWNSNHSSYRAQRCAEHVALYRRREPSRGCRRTST